MCSDSAHGKQARQSGVHFRWGERWFWGGGCFKRWSLLNSEPQEKINNWSVVQILFSLEVTHHKSCERVPSPPSLRPLPRPATLPSVECGNVNCLSVVLTTVHVLSALTKQDFHFMACPVLSCLLMNKRQLFFGLFFLKRNTPIGVSSFG